VIDSDGVLSEISLEKLSEIIGGNVDDMIKKNERSHEVLIRIRMIII